MSSPAYAAFDVALQEGVATLTLKGPGKGNAMYKCRMKNLIRGSVLDRTYKGGDSLESADVEEIDCQYLYKQGETFVFMDNANFEQYELTADQVDASLRYQIMDVVDQIRWIPDFGHERELDWLLNMHDWMISKKRYWGLALPIYD